MRKNILLIGFLVTFFAPIHSNAQTKKLTIEDAVFGKKGRFHPETLQQLQWKGSENVYTFVEKNELKAAQPGSEATTILFLEDLNEAIIDAELDELDNFPEITWVDANTIQFYAHNNLIHFQVKRKWITLQIPYPAEAENLCFDAFGQQLAYTKKNNIYIMDESSNEIAVTSDKNRNFVNGQSVSRCEYGIYKGIFWSPDGKHLAFYRKNETDVATFPLVDITTDSGTLIQEKYPMAGTKSEQISLGVYNLDRKETVWINPTDFSEEQYLTNITWGPLGKHIYIQVLNRQTTHVKLNQYEAKTGRFVKTILEEKNHRWLEPQHELIFLTKNLNGFIYQTNNRDGYNHLYVYNTDGELLKQLTRGNWEVTEVLGFDKEGKNIYYLSTEISPLERHAYKVNIKTGEKVRLTHAKGYHDVQLSEDASYLIDNYSSQNIPRIMAIINSKGEQVQQLVKAKNKLQDYQLGEITLGSIKSADKKTNLYYRLIKPVNFNPDKKYPVMVYVYGGPLVQLVKNTWMGNLRLWEQYMAQEGYVVFALDNRGSANRGKEFEAVIYRQLGQAEMADQMEGVKFLKSMPYVDTDRIGVYGWSYGGFMAISLLVNYPETFQVAVAGGAVIDWKWYEVMYTERYMDTPQENPEGYAKTSLINRVKDVKGKLLICQGALDKSVLWKHSLGFVRECIKNNVQVDYFPYPVAKHNIRGKDRVHLLQKVTNYFNDYLK